MDFSFTEEQELLAENLVEFMDREYPESLIKECDEQKIFPVEANKKFYEAGFGAIGVPEELGGVPADMVTMCLVTSIVYRYSWAGCTYSPLSIMNAADKASPEIRTEMLEGLMSGEKRHSFGNTEPGAGSDAAGIKTSYKKVDGGYVINGIRSTTLMPAVPITTSSPQRIPRLMILTRRLRCLRFPTRRRA